MRARVEFQSAGGRFADRMACMTFRDIRFRPKARVRGLVTQNLGSPKMPPVIRSQPFGRLMARLALVAMLLTVFAPIVSRALQAHSTTAVGALQEMALCTTEGLQTRLVALLPGASIGHGGHHGGADPMGHGGGDPGDACGYCSLVVPQVLLLALLLGLLPLALAAPSARLGGIAPRPWRNARGLGSQAPPITL